MPYQPGLLVPHSGGNDGNTKLLLHFDGASGGTSMPDSAAGHTVAHDGVAYGAGQTHQTSWTTPKFGTASLLIPNGATGQCNIPDHAELRPGSGDFTYDFWVYLSIAGNNSILSKGPISGSFLFQSTTTDPPKFNWYSFGGVILTETNTMPWNTWTHKAIVRSAGVLTIYSNGVANGSVADAHNYADTNQICLGGNDAYGYSQAAGANIDEFRYSSVARWTANFSPPTAPY